MKERNILVFIPNSLDFAHVGYLQGQRRLCDDSDFFYITSDKTKKDSYHSIGFVGEHVDYNLAKKDVPIFINSFNKQYTIKNNEKDLPVTIIEYDYHRFKNSYLPNTAPENYGENFKFLSTAIKQNTNSVKNGRHLAVKFVSAIIWILNFFLKILQKLKLSTQHFTTFTHFEESIKAFKWFLCTLVKEKKITPKLGNLLVAKFIDFALGMLITIHVLKYEKNISLFINCVVEEIISNLRGLLVYLMGQPIGLKLNHGFNNFLGQFYLYNISLWKAFLLGLNPTFSIYFRFFVIPGYLGLSYQIAMISDIVSIATFHSYCIYVYAAKLFNLQLLCLLSLWRLLIGRKLNPLRNRVDSCQYSQNQLLIGTLTFTILLFLLPSTAMYYVVFSVFRLTMLLYSQIFLIARNIMYSIPLYSVCLWMLNSSSVAGKITINLKSYDSKGNVIIQASLEKLPFMETIQKFTPDSMSIVTNQRSAADIIHSTITGTYL